MNKELENNYPKCSQCNEDAIYTFWVNYYTVDDAINYCKKHYLTRPKGNWLTERVFKDEGKCTDWFEHFKKCGDQKNLTENVKNNE